MPINTEVIKNNTKKKTRKGPKNTKKIIIIAAGAVVVILAVQLIYTFAFYDKAFNGVHMNGINVEKMNKLQIENLLTEEFVDKPSQMNLTLKSGEDSYEISFQDLGVNYDVKSAADQAFAIGRKGNAFTRLKTVLDTNLNDTQLCIPVTYDDAALENAIDEFYNRTLIEAKNPQLLIEGGNVSIKSGHKGSSIDKDMALKLAQDTIINCEDKVVQLEKVELLPEKISVDEYFTLLNREPKNASVKVADNKLVYEAESPGISIDRTTLEAIVSEIENSQDNQVTLPVAFSSPQLGLDALKAMVFRDTLSTKSTQFYTGNTNDMNRGQNIRISVEKINGKILGPGETFSFNQVVGPRTVSNGYKIAHVYANGKVVDDVGGGICQVSTTLYNAALFSDLETVSRTNHMFTVGYIPLGQDAAVAYDYTDLKFKNNTNYPIKIEGWVTPGNQVYFSIKGTNEAPGKIVEITNKTTRVNEFQTKYIDDPNMDEGKSYVKTGGMTGYVVDTYKTIKQNGQVISQNKIYTSVYNPLTSEVVKGTKKPDPLPEASPNNGDNKAQAQN